MKKLVYSPRYKRRLTEIKKYLDAQFGVDIRKKALRTITDRLHQIQRYEGSDVSLRELYGINTEYKYIFVAHNYVFYKIEADCVHILTIYNEREDLLLDIFGISSTDQDAEAYWNEVGRNHRLGDGE